jgi:hypothetical protein
MDFDFGERTCPKGLFGDIAPMRLCVWRAGFLRASSRALIYWTAKNRRAF